MQLEKRESGNSEGAKAQGISLSNMTGHGRPTHPFFVRTRTAPNYPDVLLAYLKNILRVCSIHIFPGENINHHEWMTEDGFAPQPIPYFSSKRVETISLKTRLIFDVALCGGHP